MNLQQIKEQSDRHIQDSFPKSRVPGAKFLALNRDGSTIYSGCAGTISQGSEQPITDDTVFWMASATKILTAMCAVKCVDQGLITLDENVLPHLPDLEKQQVRHAFMTPEFKLIPREGQVTLRQLLTMTAGVSYPVLESNMDALHTIPTGSTPFIKADKSGYVGPFECQPGTKWSYSGALDWAGALVEKLSGLSLGEYLQKYILGPCGVQKDGVTFHLTPEQRQNLAGAHFRWPDGAVTARGKIYEDDVQAHLGGVGAYATADAFAQVLLPLANDGRHPLTGAQVIGAELVHEMFKPQLTEEQREWLDRPTPANMMQVLLPGIAKQWGLGFLLLPNGMPSGRGANAGTWAGFANTHWLVDPTKGTVMIVFAQLIPQEDAPLLEIRDGWEKIIYDHMSSDKSSLRAPNGEFPIPNTQEAIAVGGQRTS